MPLHDGRRAFAASLHPAIDPRLLGGVVAIGNFDGVHRGHQAVLAAARAAADRDGLPALALTFEPHPRSWFRPGEPLFRLTPPPLKARLVAALGLDGLVTLPFDAALAARSAEAFVAEVLVGELGVRRVAIGWNFHFGAGRGGDPDKLTRWGSAHGFETEILPPFDDESGRPVSSSRIRAALGRGDLAEAAGLLGWHWVFEGEVVHGDKRGRTLGYPTANVRLPPATDLAYGIYAVVITIDGVAHQGVASWGRRPTFDDGAPVFETFVFDFTGDLYGRSVTIRPVSWLRPEMKFDGVDALIAQMDRDSAEARAILAALPPPTILDRALDDLRPGRSVW